MMFCIAIALKSAQWRLMYKTREAADRDFLALCNASEPMQVADDFGQLFFGKPDGIVLEDLNQSKQAMVELSLHNARVQIAANRAAQSDPSLKANALSTPNGGMPMMTPIPGRHPF